MMEENSYIGYPETESDTDAAEYPAWFDGKINEVLFCADFLREHPMVCVHDSIFTADGWVSDESCLKRRSFSAVSWTGWTFTRTNGPTDAF